MKRLFILVAAFFIGMASLLAQANVQFINASADPNHPSLDIYVNGVLQQDNIAYKTATTFLSLPAGVATIAVAPANSTSQADSIGSRTLNFSTGVKYIITLSGVGIPANFDNNPSGKNIKLNSFALPNAKTASGNPALVEFTAFHAATDAKKVNLKIQGVGNVVTNLDYGNYSAYIPIFANTFYLDVEPVDDPGNVVATYQVDFSAAAGKSCVLLANGFVSPVLNQGGTLLNLVAVYADGTIQNMPFIPQCKLQLIHNAADPMLNMIDIYVNGFKLIDNFAFRQASPYFAVPANEALYVGIAPANSVTADDTLKNFTITFQNQRYYTITTRGVLNPANFASNPEGLTTEFDLSIFENARDSSGVSTMVDVLAHHGVTDGISVDLLNGTTPVIDNIAYKQYAGYVSVPPAVYNLKITPASNNLIPLYSYTVDLAGLQGQSVVLMASGFITPAANQNGAAFCLLTIKKDGQVFCNWITDLDDAFALPLTIAPVPANEYLSITLPQQGLYSAEILDLSGKVVRLIPQVNDQYHRIQVADLANGMYYIRLHNQHQVWQNKFSVQH